MSARRGMILAAAVAALVVVAVVVLATRSSEKHATALPPGAATSVAVAPDGTVMLGGGGFVVDGPDVNRVQGPVAGVTSGGFAVTTVLSGGRYAPELLRASGDVLARAPIGDGDAIARGGADMPGGGAVVVADATHGGRRVVAVARYDGGGHLLGTTFVAMPGKTLSAADVAVTRGGSIVVAGTAYDAGGTSDVFLARVGGAPRILPSHAEGTVARALALEPSGRPVIAASGRRSGRSVFIALSEGRAPAVVSQPGEAFATGIAADARGGVVLAGRVNGRGVLVRLAPSGQVDPNFHAPPLPNGPQLALATDRGGGVIVAGTRVAGGRQRVAVMRVDAP